MPEQIKNAVGRVMESIAGGARSFSVVDSDNDRKSKLEVVNQGKARNPLLEDGFTPIPRVLDDLGMALGQNRETRLLARALPLVVLHLARYTDTAHGDVIVTNQSIAERRGVGLPAVKATLKLLLKLNVIRKEDPSFERRLELQKVPGGFSGNRRRFVWNPQSLWQLPKTENENAAVGIFWNEYYKKATRAESKRYP